MKNILDSFTRYVCDKLLFLIIYLIVILLIGLVVVFFYPNCNVSFVNIGTALGASITFLLWQLRNEEMSKQTKFQYKIFNEDKQFSNFLEATKLLTDKDSTTEAKIAAMFSLADVAKAHPRHLGRIIQVLNKELIPLIELIAGNASDERYAVTLKEKQEMNRQFRKKQIIEIFDYTKNKLLSRIDKDSRKVIKNWQYNGNETEMVVSVSLYVIRKIILELKDFDSEFDFSNTIFFDIDHKFDKKSIGEKFIRKNNKRIENAIFLDCQLKGVDFSKTNFHFCKFINCDLNNVDFGDANLWGTCFDKCNLKNVEFTNVECEGVEFINCKSFLINTLKKNDTNTVNQVKEFEFISDKGDKYTRPSIKYLVVIDDITITSIKDDLNSSDNKLSLDQFITLEEYEQWKNSDKG